MFYKLSAKYLLRGWDRLPYGVVDTSNGLITFLDKEMMDVLLSCNGRIDFDLPLFSKRMKEIVVELAGKGYVIACDKADPIDPIQEYKKHDNRFIRQAHWSITGRCNYKCRHCYMSAPDAKLGELSHDVIMKIIDELSKCGVYTVSLTGGEPLVRSDFWEIVDALKERRIYIETIYSNGFLVKEELLKGLRDRGLNPRFNMSFDGTEGWHEWLRGIPDAFEHIDSAFRLCRDYGFSTAAEMCLHTRNKNVLRESINYLASVGCEEVKTNPVSNSGAWFEGGYGTSIEIKDLYDLYLDYIPKYYEDGKPLSLMLGGFFFAKPGTDKYLIPMVKSYCSDTDLVTVCGHARNVMYISPEGRALPCFSLSGTEIQNRYPSIPEKGLRYCLTDSNYMKLIETPASEVLKHNERCNDCLYSRYCRGGCRAAALEYVPDDILAIDESTCMIFKDGYIDRIMETVSKADPNAVCISNMEKQQ